MAQAIVIPFDPPLYVVGNAGTEFGGVPHPPTQELDQPLPIPPALAATHVKPSGGPLIGQPGLGLVVLI